VFALISAAASCALAAPSLEHDTRRDASRDLALVVSGGVSLGAYQAGFLYYLIEAERAPGSGPIVVPLVAGASAGSANGLLAAISACSPAERDPMSSLGWRVWGSTGFDELLREDAVRREGLFSRRGLVRSTEAVWKRLAEGLPESCDFVLGVTTTRLEPLEIELGEGLRIPRQEEKFAIRVRGRGPGRPVRFTNYVDPYSEVAQPVLPFEDGESPGVALRNFERLRSVLFASMAFPIAFPPQWVAHCLTEPPDQTRYLPTLDYECPLPDRTDAFVDGGVLDNAPLRLAHAIADGGLRTDRTGSPRWRDLTVSGWTDRRPAHTALSFAYVDPSLTVYPSGEAPPEGPPSTDAVDLARDLFGNFVYTARSKELYTLVEDRASGAPDVQISHRYQPSAGDPLYAFMGFFERDFRWFDFYLGMYDAYRFARSDRGDEVVPFDALGPGPEAVPPPWRPFACIVGWLEPGREPWRATCRGPELRDFRILLQVSIDRLWDQCRRFGPDVPVLEPHAHCRAAARGEPRPRIVEHAAVDDPGSRARGEWHAKYALRRLVAYEFEFEDLGLERDQARRAQAALRQRMIRAFSLLGREQRSDFNRALLGLGGRVLANQLAYESPRWQLAALFGSSLEAALLTSFIEPWRSWFRLDVALQARGWLTALTPDPAYIALGVVAGPEIVLPFLTGSFAQTAVGLRVGYQFSSRDGIATDACRPRPGETDPRACSQVLLQPFVALGVLDRFRLQVGVDIHPDAPSVAATEERPGFDDGAWALFFGAGVTFF